MKTPKVDTPKSKFKFNTPKSGHVRKSLGQISNKSVKKLSSKGTDQVLSFLKENEGNIEYSSINSKKMRMSLPAHALNSTTSPAGFVNGKTPKKPPKSPAKKTVTPEISQSGKKKSIANKTSKQTDSHVLEVEQLNTIKTPQNKNKLKYIKTPASVENNTSPIKQNLDSKKVKVPLNLDGSLANNTHNGLEKKKVTTPEKSMPNSPEVQLGLQLEKALSPKSKKGKKKKLINGKLGTVGKVGLSKKVVNKVTDSSKKEFHTDAKSKKQRRNKKYKGKVELKPSIFKHSNALNAVNAVLNVLESKKTDLLDSDQYVYLQFNLVKLSKKSRGVYKILLPHSILPDSPEVCLISPDLKGKRNEPEEAIDHYKEILKQNDITTITEIIPLRKFKQEYYQYEERNKFANRFDCIISDGRIYKLSNLGKTLAKYKKCVLPIKFSSKNLKEDFKKALRKVCIFNSGKGASYSVKCGRIGMSAGEIADNIITIGEFFANNEALIGESKNINSVFVKTVVSDAFPVFISTVTPNEVKKPKGKEKKIEQPVEGEVTTVQEAMVVVYPSGNVKVKKRKNEENNDGVEHKLKPKPQKKKKTDTIQIKEEDSHSDRYTGNEGSDGDSENNEFLHSSDEDNSDTEHSMNSIEAEDVSEDEDGNEDNSEDDDDDKDNSLKEEEIETAEKGYLKQLRILQDEIDKQKGEKLSVKPKDGDKKGKKINSQSTVGRNENQFQKNMKGRSPQQSLQRKGKKNGQGKGPNNRSVTNFQKGSPGQGRKQKFKNKKCSTGKNKN